MAVPNFSGHIYLFSFQLFFLYLNFTVIFGRDPHLCLFQHSYNAMPNKRRSTLKYNIGSQGDTIIATTRHRTQ